MSNTQNGMQVRTGIKAGEYIFLAKNHAKTIGLPVRTGVKAGPEHILLARQVGVNHSKTRAGLQARA